MKKFAVLGIACPSVLIQSVASILMLSIITQTAFGAETIEEVLVTGSPFKKSEETFSRPANVLSGNNLKQSAATTLGETLNNEVGLSSASFGPGVGLPIIRGQSDNRIKVMQDSVGAMDASAASPDHAISLEPLLAKRIEILRGPAALRFGSGAVGGVVNVIDNRIPDEMPAAMEGGIEVRANSNNRESAMVASVTQPLENVALHVDGLTRHSGDTQIAGYAAQDLTFQTETNHHKIENTSARTQAASLGLSYFYDKNYVGVSVNHLDNNYGIPPSDDERVRIDLHQTRLDVKGEQQEIFDFAEQLSWHLGAADYKHTEMEDGAPGTVFINHAAEGRVELSEKPIQTAAGKIQWAQGFQFSRSDFSALGEEAFIPKSLSQSLGFFVLQDWTLNQWSADLGARYERNSISPDLVSQEEKTFSALNISAAGSYRIDDHQKINLSVARSARAPSVEELLANGPHPATGAFLVGDTQLTSETSKNIDLGYHWHNEMIEASLSAYRNNIDDYIYALDTGLEQDDLRLFNYSQADATFTGYEAEIRIQFSNAWSIRVMSDSVSARLTGIKQDLPRIPPHRLGFDINYAQPHWNTQLKSLRAQASHPGVNESPTKGYTRLDWYLNYSPMTDEKGYSLFAKITNLTNAEIRNASSYLRDWAPEAGRAIHVGMRLIF